MLKRLSIFPRLLKLNFRNSSATKKYTQTTPQAKYRDMANPRLTEDLGDLGADIDLEEKFQGRGNQGGGGRGRGKGGRGGKAGGGGGNPQNKEIQISKALSKLLRHAAADAGVKLDSEGYARLDEVVSHSLPFTQVRGNLLSA
jgi:2'-phosphotransferase